MHKERHIAEVQMNSRIKYMEVPLQHEWKIKVVPILDFTTLTTIHIRKNGTSHKVDFRMR